MRNVKKQIGWNEKQESKLKAEEQKPVQTKYTPATPAKFDEPTPAQGITATKTAGAQTCPKDSDSLFPGVCLPN